MSLVDDIITRLLYFAKLYEIDSLFVVGDFCRESYFGSDNISNIEVLSVFEDQTIELGKLFSSEILNLVPILSEQYNAVQIPYETEEGKMNILFQDRSIRSYMQNEEVVNWLDQHTSNNVLINNLYGRSFTCNSLIFSLSKEKMLDPLDVALRDFQKKQLVSLLPVELLIKYNPSSVFDALRYSLKYGLVIDGSLHRALFERASLLSNTLSEERIVKEIVRILKINAEKAMKLLQRYELAQYLLIPEIKKCLKEAQNE